MHLLYVKKRMSLRLINALNFNISPIQEYLFRYRNMKGRCFDVFRTDIYGESTLFAHIYGENAKI